jgi:hypothetical protein
MLGVRAAGQAPAETTYLATTEVGRSKKDAVIGKPSTVGDTVESKDACGRGKGKDRWLGVRFGTAAHCHRGGLPDLGLLSGDRSWRGERSANY